MARATARQPFTGERFVLAAPRVRPVTDADMPFCWDMLYEAAIVSSALRGLPMADVLGRPGVTDRLSAWGRPGDLGCVAVTIDGAALGAAWQRLLAPTRPGLGERAPDDAPEITIAVRRGYRGLGVGSALLAALAGRAREAGWQRLAVSVDPQGGAVRFFRRHGFVAAGRRVGPLGVRELMIGEIG